MRIINNNALIIQKKYRIPRNRGLPSQPSLASAPGTACTAPLSPRLTQPSISAALLLLCLYTGAAAPVMANGMAGGQDLHTFGLCRPDPRPLVPVLPARSPGLTVLTADEAISNEDDIVTMTGSVEALSDGQMLQADTATYERHSARVQAQGNVRYLRGDILLDGDRGEIYLDDDSGEIDNARFRLFDRHARGEAQNAHFLDRNTTHLRSARYTTCDPGNESWLLRAGRVKLDRSTGTGTAHHVSLSFMGVPFLYTPWLSFPIDDRRKSGLLPPRLRDSSRNGVEFSMPYYLNLAPRYDATLTPRIMSDRGTMLESELRYLNPGSDGHITLSYLGDDRVQQRKRSLLGYRHSGYPAAGLTFDVDYNRVSDAEYFRDFGNNLSTTAITHLDQRAIANYQANTWMASARIQRYQTVDETITAARRPYRQAPALMFRSQLPEYNFRPNYRLTSSYVDFRHNNRIEGRRLEIQPALSLPMYTMAAYLQPTLSLRHTRYELDDIDGSERAPNRTLPVFTVDAGVFLERNVQWGGRSLLQTLEPRLYYLHTPYRNQDQLPLFDTGIPDFNFTQLFRDNRFNGADRVGDANQLSTALVTRLIDMQTGRERLQAGIGRIHYFRDREVQTAGTAAAATARTSDIVAEANAAITSTLSLRLDARHSEELERIDMGGIALQYRPAPRSLINASYRFRESSLEQTDLTVLWPLGRRWHMVARHNYSLHDERTLETLAGVEYRSCCWRARIVNRRYLDSTTTGAVAAEYNRSIYLQIEFIGLASLGDDLESLLERGILGN